jgi:hypothetical protein
MAVSVMLKSQKSPAIETGGKGGKITGLPGLCQLIIHIPQAKQAVSKVVDHPWQKA